MIDRTKIRKILVFTLSNIGDVILTTPVISLIRKHFPEAHLSILLGPRGVSIFDHCKTVDDVILFDKKDFWLDKLKLILKLRRARYDCVVDLRNSLIAWLIGARYKTSIWMDRTDYSMRKQHLKRARFLIPSQDEDNEFDFFSDAEQASALKKFQENASVPGNHSFIILAPGAGSDVKRWTISGFAQVADHLVQTGRSVVLVGGKGEAGLGEELEQKISKPVVNLIGALTLRELAGLMARASLVVANDSSAMHLAHELDRPTVSIFGPTHERKCNIVGPKRKMVRLHLECTPCEQAQCRFERRYCLDDLPAALVIQACEELLSDTVHSA